MANDYVTVTLQPAYGSPEPCYDNASCLSYITTQGVAVFKIVLIPIVLFIGIFLLLKRKINKQISLVVAILLALIISFGLISLFSKQY